jgi:hypothetical protein
MNRSFSLKMLAVVLLLNATSYLHAGEQARPLPVTIKTKALYYNRAQSANFTKNNCPEGFTGSTVTYTVPMGAYSSDISQADADAQALNDVYTNGQSFANAFGTCSL